MKRVRAYEKKLEREREKLGRLIDATMDEPIALNEEILAQSKRVDDLLSLLHEMPRDADKAHHASLASPEKGGHVCR